MNNNKLYSDLELAIRFELENKFEDNNISFKLIDKAIRDIIDEELHTEDIFYFFPTDIDDDSKYYELYNELFCKIISSEVDNWITKNK